MLKIRDDVDLKELEKFGFFLKIKNERKYRKKYIEERRAEQPNLLFPDLNEVYERYFKLKEENKELQYKYDLLMKKIENKIEEFLEYDKKCKTYTKDGRENFTLEYFKAKTLQELLEEE